MKTKRLMFAMLFLAALSIVGLVAGCGGGGGGSDDSIYGSVMGFVTDAGGSPLSDVRVTIDQNSATTDANGEYIIDFLTPGIRTVTAVKTGYQVYNGTVNVVGSTLSPKNFVMVRDNTGTVKGTVTAISGGTLQGVTVTIGSLSDVTGADGTYNITGVPAGESNIIGSKTGYATYSSSVSVASGETVVKNFELQPGSTGTVSGQVTSTLGGPLENAEVSIGSIKATTKADGSYTLAGVETGMQTIQAQKSGYRNYSSQVNVVLDQTVTKNIEMSPQ